MYLFWVDKQAAILKIFRMVLSFELAESIIFSSNQHKLINSVIIDLEGGHNTRLSDALVALIDRGEKTQGGNI